MRARCADDGAETPAWSLHFSNSVCVVVPATLLIGPARWGTIQVHGEVRGYGGRVTAESWTAGPAAEYGNYSGWRISMAHTAKTAAQMVTEAKERVQNLTPEQVSAELQQSSALLIDLRESNEREANGVIPGAVHAPRGMLEFWADPTSPYHREEFDPGRRVILHCASGGRSALAADTLQQMGYTDVAHLNGGMKAWKEAGFPVEEVPRDS